MRFPIALFLSILVTAAYAQAVIIEEFPSFARGQYLLTHTVVLTPNKDGEYKEPPMEDYKKMEEATAVTIRPSSLYFPGTQKSLHPTGLFILIGEEKDGVKYVGWYSEIPVDSGDLDKGTFTEVSLVTLFNNGAVLFQVTNLRTKLRTRWVGRELK